MGRVTVPGSRVKNPVVACVYARPGIGSAVAGCTTSDGTPHTMRSSPESKARLSRWSRIRVRTSRRTKGSKRRTNYMAARSSPARMRRKKSAKSGLSAIGKLIAAS